MKKLTIIAIMLFATQSLMAWSTSPVTKIDRIFVYPEFVVLAIENNTVADEGCASTNFVAFSTIDSSGKSLYSAALTAHTTGGKVRFGHNGCLNWSGGVPEVYRIEMIK